MSSSQPPLDSPAGKQASPIPFDWETRRSTARHDLGRICKAHPSPDQPIDTVLLEGRVTDEIRQWVSQHDVDLAVLCSHGAGGWNNNGLASTAKHLVQSLSVPTLLIPASILDALPNKDIAYERILVPLDASPEAEQALSLAVRLAREHGSEIILIHVVPVPELIKPEPLNDEERELEKRLIEREQPSLIILSGHGRGGRTPLRLGSVASFLVEHATAPTLIVRPRSHLEIAL